MPPEDRPPLFEIPDGPYEGEPPDIWIPEGRARRYKVKPTPPRQLVESQVPYLREAARLGRMGAQWDFQDEPIYGPTRPEYRNTVRRARQERHEDIIRLRAQQRDPWGGELPSPPTPQERWMDEPWDIRPRT
jgi:hypothetical protein